MEENDKTKMRMKLEHSRIFSGQQMLFAGDTNIE